MNQVEKEEKREEEEMREEKKEDDEVDKLLSNFLGCVPITC